MTQFAFNTPKADIHIEDKNRKAIKRLRILDGDVILIKAGTPLANYQVVERLSTLLKMNGLQRYLIAIVEDWDHIRRFDEKDMEDLGWIRK